MNLKHMKINNRFDILTPTGFQHFLGIKESIKETLKFIFDDLSDIVVTPDHRFISNEVEITANTLSVNDVICGKIIVDIIQNGIQTVYDPIEVLNGNAYISNDLVSHNCHFLGSANTLIDATTLGSLSPKPFVYSTQDGLDILEKPTPNHFYALVADTSEGVGGDFSAFVLIDITVYPFKLVAKYKNNKISPMLYPNVIHKVALEYNNAYVLIEINKSQEVAMILYDEYEYENMISVKRGTKGQVPVDGGYSKGLLGVTTDKKVKRQGCQALKSLMEEKKLLIFDTDVIGEFTTFIEKNGSFAGDSGAHDDLVMCLVLFGWLTSSEYFKDMTNMDTRKELYSAHMDMIESSMLPVGWLVDGTEQPQYVNF
jgi:hypothetical protein